MFPNTGIFFLSLIKRLKIDCVCDIGSLDGTQAIRFNNALPGARVFAFEANPHNFSIMQSNPLLKSSSITLSPIAVYSSAGMINFHVVDIKRNGESANRGLSSIMMPGDPLAETVKVPSVRIDDFLAGQAGITGSIALWIDVEGAAYDVLAGMERIREQVAAVHVEVEKKTMFTGQKLAGDVERLMKGWGFKPIASEFWLDNTQGNVLYVNAAPAGPSPADITLCAFRASAATLIELGIRPLRKALSGARNSSIYQAMKKIYHRRII